MRFWRKSKMIAVDSKVTIHDLAKRTVGELTSAELNKVKKFTSLQNKIGKLRAQIEEVEDTLREKMAALALLEADVTKLND